MRSIGIIAQKGGAGKTTLTVHLAVAALHAGERVAILDTDPQQSALTWSETREAEEPTVIAIDAGEVTAALEEARRDGYTLVLVDTTPRAAPIGAAIVRAVSYALIPQRPAAFDLATLERSVAIVAAAKTPAAIVLNACPTRAPEVAEAREVCAEQPIPLAPVELGDRRAFARAVQSGRAVEEFDPRSAAADEIRRLWAYVDKRSNSTP
jgi:chromosome partitioning protein